MAEYWDNTSFERFNSIAIKSFRTGDQASIAVMQTASASNAQATLNSV